MNVLYQVDYYNKIVITFSRHQWLNVYTYTGKYFVYRRRNCRYDYLHRTDTPHRTYLSFQYFRFCLLIPGFTSTIFIFYFEYPHVRAKDTTYFLWIFYIKRRLVFHVAAFSTDIYNVRTPIKLPLADKNIKAKIYFERVCKKNTYKIFSYTLRTFQSFAKF